MSERVLEIGAGRHPAIANPGTVFTREDAAYVGLDAHSIVEPMALNFETFEHEIALTIQKIIGNAACTHLAANQFDHVIYRSVFGQFTPNDYWPEDKAPKEKSFGAYWTDVADSIAETKRILKPGGTLCIAEEDTPVPPRNILPLLALSGFEHISLTESQMFRRPGEEVYAHGMTISGDIDWLAIRVRYWSNRAMSATGFLDYRYRVLPETASRWSAPAFSGSFYRTQPYIITALKSFSETD